MVVGLMFFTACDNDDSTPEIISVKDVEGNYAGKMVMAIPAPTSSEGISEGVAVEAKAMNDTVYFDAFPVDELLALIVGDGGFPDLNMVVRRNDYKIGYTAELNADYTQIGLALDPKPFECEVIFADDDGDVVEVMPMLIEISVVAPEKGIYTYDGKNLQFGLIADKVKANGKELADFKSQGLNFNVTKQ